MKHKNFKDHAELLEAAAASIRMQEAAGVEPVCRYCDCTVSEWMIKNTHFDSYKCHLYQFPLAVVEGGQVWEGDELYTKDGIKCKLEGVVVANSMIIYDESGSSPFLSHYFTWNPPKPKTVMVELLEEDVKEWVKLRFIPPMHEPTYRIYRACVDAIKAKE